MTQHNRWPIHRVHHRLYRCRVGAQRPTVQLRDRDLHTMVPQPAGPLSEMARVVPQTMDQDDTAVLHRPRTAPINTTQIYHTYP
jgi:hypothetical protein